MTPSTKKKNWKVLIVDDEEHLREALAYDFDKIGCEITLASNGHEAFRFFMESKFDIVISDVRMPNGSGVELLEKIRAVDPKLPIVLLVTGFADITEPEAIKKGAAARFEKPIDRKKLMAFLESIAEELLPQQASAKAI